MRVPGLVVVEGDDPATVGVTCLPLYLRTPPSLYGFSCTTGSDLSGDPVLRKETGLCPSSNLCHTQPPKGLRLGRGGVSWATLGV